MNFEAINHIPKSHMAYAIDEEHLHILIQTAKNDVVNVKLVIGDPFEWIYLDGKYVWSGDSLEHKKMVLKYSTELFDYFFIEVKTINLRSKYSFIIDDGNCEYFYGCRDLVKLTEENRKSYISNLFGYFNYPYINIGDLNDSPKWAKNMIWYQIFPDRFSRDDYSNNTELENKYFEYADSNNYYYGGTINGITNRIPYLVDLGITGIYFTPIFKAYSPHKYDTEDYFTIDPAFGTNEDLKLLIDECHKVGIKVMLDAVFNHCGYDHPYFQDVIRNKKNSKYWDCFFIDDEDFINFDLDELGHPIYKKLNLRPKYKAFGFTPMMPKWNADNIIAEEYLLSVATYWVREYDIDGWRLDVSNEVSHSFWRKFRKAVKSIKSDVYILGENWDDSTAWLRGDQFDAVMNYEVAYPIWQFFGKEKDLINISAESFMYRINKLLLSYPENVTINMFNMIGSHDTSRILQKCNGNYDLVKLSHVFLFSFSGSPALYYGDEVGLGELRDKDCRRPMIWDDRQNENMLNFFKRMIIIRKNNSDLSSTNIKWLYTCDKVLIYKKGNTYLLLNNNDFAVDISLPKELQNQRFADLYNELEIDLNTNILIPTYGFYILQN
ncbi:glycoside hydrolase family 13 protein [Mycoplasmatota bacterium WC30]